MSSTCKWCGQAKVNDLYGDSCENCWADRQDPSMGSRQITQGQYRDERGCRTPVYRAGYGTRLKTESH